MNRQSTEAREALRKAYLAGATDVHIYWQAGGSDTDPDFAEAALDYANDHAFANADDAVDSGMSGDAVERAEAFWANLPTTRRWTSLATHEKALVCHQLAALESTPQPPSEEVVEAVARAIERADNETGYEYDHLHIECSDWGIHLARAAIAAMPSIPQDGWRDIETAPKDTHILVWGEAVRWRGVGGLTIGYRHSDERDDRIALDGRCGTRFSTAEVTHWRPLPEPPGSTVPIPQESDAEVTITREAYDFLMGEGPLEGVWFGDLNDGLPGAFWWRRLLKAAAGWPEPAMTSARDRRG